MLQMNSLATASGSVTIPVISTATVPKDRNVWIVLGPAGSGKSTVCQRLANAVGGSYIEGDDVRIAPSMKHQQLTQLSITPQPMWPRWLPDIL